MGEMPGNKAVPFDVLTTTASQLRERLQAGTITSVAIVKSYLTQIENHNHAGAHLNAMLSMPTKEKLFKIANTLDEERAARQLRGPLHGIPITLKDAFATDVALGMNTTVGSYALLDSKPSATAAVVDAVGDP